MRGRLESLVAFIPGEFIGEAVTDATNHNWLTNITITFGPGHAEDGEYAQDLEIGQDLPEDVVREAFYDTYNRVTPGFNQGFNSIQFNRLLEGV